MAHFRQPEAAAAMTLLAGLAVDIFLKVHRNSNSKLHLLLEFNVEIAKYCACRLNTTHSEDMLVFFF